MIVNGDITLRIGSQDYVTLQLLQDDGVTPINLSAFTKAILKLRDVATSNVTSFDSTAQSPLFFIIDASLGKVELRPLSTTFQSEKLYKYYVEIYDDAGMHSVPENKSYEFRIIK